MLWQSFAKSYLESPEFIFSSPKNKEPFGSISFINSLEGEYKMFERQKVVNFWDEAGSLIQVSNTGTRAEKAIAITQLKRLAPEFHDDAISVFREANITDANSAKDFLNNAENLENIMRGRVGKKEMFQTKKMILLQNQILKTQLMKTI